MNDAQSAVFDVPMLLKKLDKLVDTLTHKSDQPILWSSEQAGEWFGLSEHTFRYKVSVRPGFPEPVSPAGTLECKKRWFADEVVEWARLNRGVLPAGRGTGRPRKTG